MKLRLLPSTYGVARLDAGSSIPEWARSSSFLSITATAEELSIVVDDSCIPEAVRSERGWSALQLEGPIPFETPGVAAALAQPLALAGIPILLIGTFDTDYLLVKTVQLEATIRELGAAGFEIIS